MAKSNVVCGQFTYDQNNPTSITLKTLTNGYIEMTIPLLVQIPISSEIPINHRSLDQEAKRQIRVMRSMIHKEIIKLVPRVRWVLTQPIPIGSKVYMGKTGISVVATKHYFYRIEITISWLSQELQKPRIPKFLKDTESQIFVQHQNRPNLTSGFF